jgi:hypothetical protein
MLTVFAFAALVVVPAARHPDTHGFAAYYTASRVLLASPHDLARVYDEAWFQSQIDASGFRRVRDIYNVQPPTMALLLVPVAWMRVGVARAVWVAASAGFWLLGCASLARALVERTARPRATLAIVAATTAFVPLRDGFRQGQCYALLFFLLALHLELSLRDDAGAHDGRRGWRAGVPLGLMLVTKQAGAWLVVLLLVGRRWRTLGGVALTASAVVLASAPWVGVEAWSRFLARLPSLASSPERTVTAYQTVTGLAGHLFTFDATWNPSPPVVAPLLATATTATVTLAVLARSARAFARAAPSHATRALSLAMAAAPAVCLAPIAESYHFVLVLPSLVVAWWWCLCARSSRRAWVGLGVATALLSVPQSLYGLPALQSGWGALLAYPRVYGSLLLWGWLLGALGGASHDTSAEPGTASRETVAS